ncbi:hypothetical protein H920_06613 [Fukomys damarensis]|uniref:Uncharacterized protein n=1 Tax=Fukomys damarensis TaxID=885580 RepID=A0A091DIT1_FUKDA|nr:hypothetical protein H920_06613 [Fukomys damarensis]
MGWVTLKVEEEDDDDDDEEEKEEEEERERDQELVIFQSLEGKKAPFSATCCPVLEPSLPQRPPSSDDGSLAMGPTDANVAQLEGSNNKHVIRRLDPTEKKGEKIRREKLERVGVGREKNMLSEMVDGY